VDHHTLYHCAYCIYQVFKKVKLRRHIRIRHWNTLPPQHVTNCQWLNQFP
jgi:hypothetical protein